MCNAPRACTKTGLPTRQSSSRREASLKSSKGVNVWIRQQHYLYLSWFPSRVKDKSKPEQGAIEGVHCAFITNVINLHSSWKEKGLPECKGACLFSSVQAVNWGGVPGYWIRSLLTWIRSLLTWIGSLAGSPWAWTWYYQGTPESYSGAPGQDHVQVHPECLLNSRIIKSMLTVL